MTESLETSNACDVRVLEIGPDKVTVTNGDVIIDAKHEMPDWKVRSFKVIPIYFDDKKYYLAEKREARPSYKVRYVLKPWVDGKFDSATIFQTYDAEAVAERDSSRRGEKGNEVAFAFLLLIYPLLGLFWSKTQQRLNRIGFVPRSITSISIFTTFCLIFGQGVFLVMSLQSSARSGVVVIGGMIRAFSPVSHVHIGPIGIPVHIFDILSVVALLADFLVRYTAYMRDDQWVGGFLEWMVPKSLRSKSSLETNHE
jgi:hypothetical protein